MKNKIENRNLFLITLALLISFLTSDLFSQEDVEKNITKVFSAGKSSVLNINTKYGDVDIRDWEQNEIKIDVQIKIHDLSSQKARQVMDYIDIDIYEEGNSIYAETKFSDAFYKSFGNKYTDDNKFEINYIIHMPSTVKLVLENKYGNVFINKLESASNITIKYGNLQANQLLSTGKEAMVEVNLGYSKGTIESCKWLRLNIKYSKINIENSQALMVLSKYSKVFIEKNSSIVCESKYDSYQVNKIANFVADAQYSHFKFEKLTNKLRLDTKYTDTKITYVSPSFESIDIDNSYGSISIGIDPSASYKLKGNAKYAKIHYPSNSRVNKFQENTEMSVEGIVGDKKGDLPYVDIETRYGSINLVK
jgi:hypothetical protein